MPSPERPAAGGGDDLERLETEITACRRCPRLVAWREQVAEDRRAAFRDEEYWGRPVPGFGDPQARLLVLGLAPAAHGGNRTGRVFTGDRSGDWLYAALFRAGYANQPTARHRDDGLVLAGCWVSAAVRCAPPANKPSPQERDACTPYLERELALLPDVSVVVALGRFAWDVAWSVMTRGRGRTTGNADVPPGPRPIFAHLAEAALPADVAGRPRTLLGSFHPSQQNTFTGRLTEPMFDAVFSRVRALTDGDGGSSCPLRSPLAHPK